MLVKGMELEIFIPTYNRRDKIIAQIKRILPQLNKQVRLTVIDNNSEYDISEFFTLEQNEMFTLIKNTINVGADNNIAKCFRLCEADWVWVLGDDDDIAEDSVSYALGLISDSRGCCYINTGSKVEEEVRGLPEFLEHFTIQGTFPAAFSTSACLYNLNILRNYFPEYHKNVSTMIPQFVWVLSCFEHDGDTRAKFVKRCLYTFQSNEISWSRVDFIN